MHSTVSKFRTVKQICEQLNCATYLHAKIIKQTNKVFIFRLN